jgi:hypothetical protein
MRKRIVSASLLPHLKRPLSEGEAIAFREDLRAADQEVQSYFRIYYIIGLIGVAAWLVSPEVKPLRELMLGNGGYNVYVPMIIAFLNSVSATYLLHKSIEIHEIAQFISYASEPKSGFLGWEQWRRSKASATRWSRRLYAPFLTAVPLGVSFVLIYASWRFVHTPVENFVSASFPKEQVESVSSVFGAAKLVLYGVVALHVIPLILIYFNIVQVPHLWTSVWSKNATTKPGIEAENKSPVTTDKH